MPLLDQTPVPRALQYLVAIKRLNHHLLGVLRVGNINGMAYIRQHKRDVLLIPHQK